MARRSGAHGGLAMSLALGTSLLWPGVAAGVNSLTDSGGYQITSHFETPAGVTTSSIALNDPVVLSIGGEGPESPISGLAITDQLPAGLVVAATPNVIRAGGFTSGTVTAQPGSSTISLTGLGFPADAGTGAVRVTLTATSPGLKQDSLTNISSDQGGPASVVDGSVDVVAPPVIGTVFDPTSLSAPGSAHLKFIITNPRGNDVALTNVSVFDSAMPMSVDNTSSATCGGWLSTGLFAGMEVNLTGASIAVGGICTFSVGVSTTFPGYYSVPSQVQSDNGGTGNTSTAALSVGYA
ncbi:MAG TPA: hypothetical protein VMU34_20035, partial [Mycobacterium sp.]|nr:hypothetical protein [Mycobacterium sp.]